MPSADFAKYLGLCVEDLLAELARVSSDIASGAGELAMARSTELEDRAAGWNQSVEETVRAREKASQFNAVGSIQQKLETAAELDALRAEEQFLWRLIDVRTRTGVLASA